MAGPQETVLPCSTAAEPTDRHSFEITCASSLWRRALYTSSDDAEQKYKYYFTFRPINIVDYDI